MNTEMQAKRERVIDAQLWGRVHHINGRQATKTDVATMAGEQAEQKILAAEEAARARAAKFRTLKTMQRPNDGLLARAIRSIFG